MVLFNQLLNIMVLTYGTVGTTYNYIIYLNLCFLFVFLEKKNW
jgi:hypothetical protein